jgi:hypothetical protein
MFAYGAIAMCMDVDVDLVLELYVGDTVAIPG